MLENQAFHSFFEFSVLFALESLLNLDNFLFITIVVSQLKHAHQNLMLWIGLSGAACIRILLLYGVLLLQYLEKPLFFISSQPVSIRQILFGLGGLFLFYKSINEIVFFFFPKRKNIVQFQYANPAIAFLQIIFLDAIFSLDSIFTAVGLTKNFSTIVTSILSSLILTLLAAKWLIIWIQKNPIVKLLNFVFLSMLGCALMASAFGASIPKKTLYGLFLLLISAEACREIYFKYKK